MNITFDPMNTSERSTVLAILAGLETPVASAPAPAPSQERPVRGRRAKADVEALAPAPVDTSPQLDAAKKAIEDVAKGPTLPPGQAEATKAACEGLPAPLPPATPAATTPPSVGELLANNQPPTDAPAAVTFTKEDMRDLMSSYAAKGQAESAAALAILNTTGQAPALSKMDPSLYAAVAAEMKAKLGWDLLQARAALKKA